MKYPVVIEPGTPGTAWGVVVPDLPGCFSAGDTLDAALDNAREAITGHVQAVLECGGSLPAAKPLIHWQSRPEYTGWVWAVVDAPVERFLGPAEKINITLPRLLLARIDDYASKHGATRSGFLAQAAIAAMQS